MPSLLENKELFKDADTHVSTPGKVEAQSSHKVIQRGNVFVCTSCSYEHTIPLDTNKYTVDNGNIVRKT